MDKVFFEELRLPSPDYQLSVKSGSHARQTGLMLQRIEAVLQKEKPEMVVVYGDTNTTLAGALVAAKLNIPIAHVEAGLRSYVRSMPEEINRVLTDHLSTFLLCPTNQAVENLAKEGIKPDRERVLKRVGDVMHDSILYYSKIAEKKSKILHELSLVNPQSAFRIRQYYLATLHRAENTDDPSKLGSILGALNEIGEKTIVLLPLHPRTRKMMKAYRLFSKSRNVKFMEPVSYLDMLRLEKNAKAILTDSGGVQKEACWFRVPCFTLREETEWVETVRSGWNVLVGTEPVKIVRALRHLEKRGFGKRSRGIFGDGKASERIIQVIIEGSVEGGRDGFGVWT
jgi:UDP-N-acetylglucosamine 2-epimerase